jgi:hypothetical protein
MTTTGGRLLTAGALGAAIVLTTGLGVATAANGGSLVLGADNTATRTTTLIDKESVPLSLVTGKSKAPLKVNSKHLVPNLNADLLDGKHRGALVTRGSGASTRFADGNRGLLGTTPLAVVSTAKLAAGTYYVQASISFFIPDDIDGVNCFTSAKGPTPEYDGDFTRAERATGENFSNVSETTVLRVAAGTRIREWCASDPGTGGVVEVIHAGLIALRVARHAAGSTIQGVPVA